MNNNLLICAPVMPEFDRESGSRRLYDLIRLLREDGWRVTFATEIAEPEPRYVDLLQRQGIPVHVGFNPQRAAELVGECRFDLALFVFWFVAEKYVPILREASPETRLIVDSVDLHFVRRAREAFCSGSDGTPRRGLDRDYGDEMVRELNAYALADSVLTVSAKEADLVNDLLAASSRQAAAAPGASRRSKRRSSANGRGSRKAVHPGARPKAFVVPDCEDLGFSDVPLAERRGVLFLGNFRHPPNVDAVEHLCRDILPRVPSSVFERHPVYVVGNGLDDRVRTLCEGLHGMRVVGWVPSVLPYLRRSRLSVVPLRYGAGTKRKLVQSLMAGAPSVSTSIGVEGLGIRHRREVLVADDPAGFAGSIEALLTDDALWTRLARAGAERVRRLHSVDVTRQALRAAVEAVFSPRRRPALAAVACADPYRELIERVRKTVASVVPQEARLAVVSKGDDRLLAFDGLAARHFPAQTDGRYAGFHPRDSAEVIEHLNSAMSEGVQYLVVPSSSFWWLSHYVQLRDHLEGRCALAWSDQDCVIYQLPDEPVQILPLSVAAVDAEQSGA
jgi:glycosyltransferase involved in cell wall biosynthesis